LCFLAGLSFGNAAKALFFLQMLGEAGFIIWKWAKNVLLRKSKLMTFIVTQQSRKIQTSRQDTSTIGTLQDHVIYNTKIKVGSDTSGYYGCCYPTKR
jgi:hypothetical protein